jgi:hypothetical protein
MIRFFYFFVLFLSFITLGQSQSVRRFHQNFDVQEATTLQITAPGKVEIVKWAGNEILVEVVISSANGSLAILNYLQKEGRYDLKLIVENGKAQLVGKSAKKQPVKAKGADMDEQVTYMISVPENLQLDIQEGEQSITKTK